MRSLKDGEVVAHVKIGRKEEEANVYEKKSSTYVDEDSVDTEGNNWRVLGWNVSEKKNGTRRSNKVRLLLLFRLIAPFLVPLRDGTSRKLPRELSWLLLNSATFDLATF